MSKIFLTSDLHLGHNKEFLYKPRGYDSIIEHDKQLIQNWNSIITDDDIVYILGDLMLGNNDYGASTFNHLCGMKHIILGNHDTDIRIAFYSDLRGVIDIKYADMIKYGKYHFYVSHYPTILKNFDEPSRVIGLHGHTHSPDKFQYIQNYSYNVALDAHNNFPIELNEILNDIKTYREENK